MTNNLTPKQARFVEEYLIDLNATQAAVRAGYSERSARNQAARLMANDDIQNAIQSAKLERSEETKIDAQWVLKQAVEMYKMASGETPVHVIVREGEGDGMAHTQSKEMRKTDFPGMGKSLEIIGKHVNIGAFEKDSQVSVGVTVIDPFKRGENEPASGGD